MLTNKDKAVKLTSLGMHSFNPIFSPNGQQIAFSSGGKGNQCQIFIINTDGNDLKCLTYEPGPNFFLCFSPDGIRITYIGDPTGEDDNYFDIYTIWTDGSNNERLTFTGAANPVFSPDGNSISFEKDVDGNRQIFRMNPDGSSAVQLTHSESRNRSNWVFHSSQHQIYSPNGEWIYYTSCKHSNCNQSEIYRIRPDGTESARLTYTHGDASNPIFSPDGQTIAYTVKWKDQNACSIYTMSPDGTNLKQIESSSVGTRVNSFSPNGDWMAFASTRDAKTDEIVNNWDIYLIRPNGSELRRITNNTSLDMNPVFSPDGKMITFYSNRDGWDEIYIIPVE